MTSEEWSTNSTDATRVSLWRPGKDEPLLASSFKPTFTYSIFGDEESIFGYKDLQINLKFAAHDLYPNISWSFDEKFKSVGDTEALDLEDAWADFVPESAFAQTKKFDKRIQEEDSSSFVPPGEKARSWTQSGRQFEIWTGQLTDPAVRALVDRVQVLIPLFIEGGTELLLEDQEWTLARWRVFFLYEKLKTPSTPSASVYSFVGYSTTYRFVTYEGKLWALDEKTHNLPFSQSGDVDVLTLPYRGRISQFLVLPPYAHQGLGSMLYATIFKHFQDDSQCLEITIEDPNEAFDDLRDYCDFTRLLQDGSLEQLRLNHNVDPKLLTHGRGRRLPTHELISKDKIKEIKKQSKIASRQFKRLIELWLLSRIPSSARQAGTARLTRRAKTSDEGDRAFYFWRLLVKQRIWHQNKDQLKELEQSEAVTHLETTVDSVLADYERLLISLAEKAAKSSANEIGDDNSPGPSKKRGKRHLVVDDDDDEESDEGRTKRQKSVLEA